MEELNLEGIDDILFADSNSETQTYSPEFLSQIEEIRDENRVENQQLVKKLFEGMTFGAGDYIEAGMKAQAGTDTFTGALEEQAEAEEDIEMKYPGLSLFLEGVGGIATGTGIQRGLAKAGVKSMAGQGAIEGGLYGLGTEGPAEGVAGAALGGAGGKLLGLLTEGRPKKLTSNNAATEEPASVKPFAEQTDDELWSTLQDFEIRHLAQTARPLYNDAEKIAKKQAKEAKKLGKAVTPSLKVPSLSIGETLVEMTKGLNKAEATELANRVSSVVAKKGGFQFSDDVLEIKAADKIFDGSNAKAMGPFVGWLQRNFSPVSEVLGTYVAPKVGSAFSRSVEKSMRNNARFMDDFVAPITPVVKFMNDDVDSMRLWLDLRNSPENIGKLANRVEEKLGKEQREAFEKWWAYTKGKNIEAKERLYRKDPKDKWDEEYVHVQKRNSMNQHELVVTSGQPYRESIKSMKSRSRKPATKMTDEEVMAYENPILSHTKHITDTENLLQFQEKFGLSPNLKLKDSSETFFASVKDRLARDGFNEQTADIAKSQMHSAYMGSRRAPPAPVRAFMNLAYAGTLAQFRSAVLNIHDTAVAAVNNGATPTLRGLLETTESEFGKSLKNMMGEQSYGEFVRDFDKFTSSPTAWSKIGKATKVVADGSMFISGFRYMDELGKGTVLRAAVNSARDAAKKGTLKNQFGDIFQDWELEKMAPWLARDVKAADMPQEVAELVEELAFTKLGEQQLISMAGRPLGYLNYPILRPAYAMSGFAIKQMALLRRNVYEQLKAGNTKEAAEYAAKYVVYAGLGYGMINETRNAVFKGEAFEPTDILLGTVDQIAAAMTLNRLGDSYSREKFAANPVDFLLTSFLPPGGLTEGMAQALFGDFEPIITRIPAGGQLMKRLMDEEE